MEILDFTNCKVNPYRMYNGANGSKKCIVYNNEQYMLKFPSHARNNKDMSYSNGVISEYIGCHIYQMLGIAVQQTILGNYDIGGKNKLVVACKDMEVNGYQLKDFASLKNTVVDSEMHGYGTDIHSVLNAIEEQEYFPIAELKKSFWDMFVVDALLGNFDRHNGNWGFLVNEERMDVQIAPIYDCGSCLFPAMDETLMEKVLLDENELLNRVYTFPNSALMENGKKISYFAFLSETDIPEAIQSLKEITKRINMEEITSFIGDTIILTDLQKEFYCKMVGARKAHILEHALDVQNGQV